MVEDGRGMVEECRGEIILPNGKVEPAERRAPTRGEPTYPRSAGRVDGSLVRDRRVRRRPRDETLRGRLIDLRG
ncbi:MAG TPA: hypothetical protein VNS22_22495 [Geminicoccus sp.]|uniref:hypothetical protein n=1 Tax=Geminicoccus sp. TaxID=2024832 RepID=UPI002BBA2546|nr:hypothetical protein [Geminicoccus sp.]HWL71129.1 hypothetical protein [Geminicoccus sp.]